MRALVFILILSQGFAATAGVTNLITRAICDDGESVRVEDKLHLITGTWNTRPVLQDILRLKREGGSPTQIRELAAKLLQNESLELVRCETDLSESFLELRMVSKVRLDRTGPVRLNCLANYAGSKFLLKLRGSEIEPFMLVFSGVGIRMLWLPEWDTPADLPKAVEKRLDDEYYFHQYLGLGSTNEIYVMRCTLRAGSMEQVLFEATPLSPPQAAPDFEFLAMVQGVQRMTGNDWRRLFTNVKPGKSGYYLISSSGLTNRPPFAPADGTNWIWRPFSGGGNTNANHTH